MRRRAARVLLDCPGRMGEDLLLHEPDARAARDRDVPGVRRFEAGGDPQQRRLSYPVRPDEAHAVPAGEPERHVAEHEPLAETLRDRLDREDAHGNRGSQRGTLARYVRYSSPKVRSSEGSSQSTTNACQASARTATYAASAGAPNRIASPSTTEPTPRYIGFRTRR